MVDVKLRVAIVGGAGFIGAAITRALVSKNVEVLVLDQEERLKFAGSAQENVKHESCCMTDVERLTPLLDGVNVLIHLACTTHPATSQDSLAYDAETNIAPSVRVFDAAAAAGVKRVIFSSSGGTVYGKTTNLPLLETSEKRPISGYGVSKLAIEGYLSIYGLLDKFEAISLRIGNPYGPFQFQGAGVGVIARYIQLLKNNEPFMVWGDGKVVRDYLYIDDLAEAFVSCSLAEEMPSGEYNVGSGVGYSINQIIERIFTLTSISTEVIYTPSRSFDVNYVVLGINKFKSKTNWYPLVGIDEGILRMWNSLNEYRNIL